MPKNTPQEIVQWTLASASTNFGVHRDTLQKRLIANEIRPSEDGTYSTAQITKAVFGDIAGEKLRKAKADADKAEMDAAHRAGELILSRDVELRWMDMAIRIRKTVEKAHFLTPEQREKMVEVLAKLKLEDPEEDKE